MHDGRFIGSFWTLVCGPDETAEEGLEVVIMAKRLLERNLGGEGEGEGKMMVVCVQRNEVQGLLFVECG